MAAGTLVLFDIDGTLVRRAGPHHRRALAEAVRLITGLETTTDGIPVHGMLDGDILRQMMSNAGAAAELIEASLPAIMSSAEEWYVEHCPDLSTKVCPGAHEVLRGLALRGVPLALVTGNLTRIGWTKLKRSGLAEFFRFGAFADMAATRAELAGIAIAEARQSGEYRDGGRILLVGDAPSDIFAARANGAVSVAVHTGISTREELAQCGPDVLLRDLNDWSWDLLRAPSSARS